MASENAVLREKINKLLTETETLQKLQREDLEYVEFLELDNKDLNENLKVVDNKLNLVNQKLLVEEKKVLELSLVNQKLKGELEIKSVILQM